MVEIAAYELNPENPRKLLDIAQTQQDMGHHDATMLLVEEAAKNNVLRSIEDRCDSIVSISGFYSKLEGRRKHGQERCETIATNKRMPWHNKETARRNSTYYAQSLRELAPASVIKSFDFVPPKKGYSATNPSIAVHNGQMHMIQRTVNYRIRDDGSYDMQGDSAIRTTNYLLTLAEDMTVITADEIFTDDNWPDPKYELVIGFEDCRLFSVKDELHCSATVREISTDGWCEIVHSRIVEKNGKMVFSDWEALIPEFHSKQHEKNWMPMVIGDDYFWLYSSDPVRIVDSRGQLKSLKQSPIASDSFRGGGSMLPWNHGWLAVIHESHVMHDNRRRYMHRFAWYDGNGRLVKYSDAFYFEKLGIEFAAGLALHPTTGDVVVTFGLDDRESWYALIRPNEVQAMLRPAASLARQFLGHAVSEFADAHVNRPMLSGAEFVKSAEVLSDLSLPLHTVGQMNQPSLVAIKSVLDGTWLSDPILDISATRFSTLLPSLYKLGYTDLVSVGKHWSVAEVIDGIRYMPGDYLATGMPDAHFSFISCMDFEHVLRETSQFLTECARVLIPGGKLFIAFPFWPEGLGMDGRTSVHTRYSIEKLMREAILLGFTVSDFETACKDATVNGTHTIANMIMRKNA